MSALVHLLLCLLLVNYIRAAESIAFSGTLYTIVGAPVGYNGDGISSTSASLYNPNAVAIDDSSFWSFSGNASNAVIRNKKFLFIADTSNHRIRFMDLNSGIIYTFAGNGNTAVMYNGDNILATKASLSYPQGIAIDKKNNLIYIADTGN